MKNKLALAAALSLAATGGCALEMDTTDIDSVEQSGRLATLPGFVAVGASTTLGVGASNPAETGSTALFASYLDDNYFSPDEGMDFQNLAVSGATSLDVWENQVMDAHLFQVDHVRTGQVAWIAAGGNDLLTLVGTPGALAPCALIPPQIPALGVSFECYDVFRAVTDAYETNLYKSMDMLAAAGKPTNAVIMARTEIPSLAEANCTTDGAIDQFGNVFIPAAEVAALQPLAELAIEGNIPAIPEAGFPGFEGINVKMRKVAAQIEAKHDIDVVVIETFAAFKGAALQGGDLVTRDCVHPNDDGHALIRDLAVAAFEAR